MNDKITTIRALDELDHQQWLLLYKNYLRFYKRDYDENKVATLWQWLKDKKIFGFVAEQQGSLIGLAHYREMLSPLNGFAVGFLDDLFVSSEYRGQAIAEQLMSSLKDEAKRRGWPFVRWITHENNYRAKAFYDRISTKTAWHTYQMDC